jgi:hypothetical protein
MDDFVFFLIQRFGESATGASDDGEDPANAFLTTLSTFSKSFRAAHADIVKQRVEMSKKAKAEEAKSKKKTTATTTTNSSSTASSSSNTSKVDQMTDNLFDLYKSSKTASPDSVIQEFKQKLDRRMGMLTT